MFFFNKYGAVILYYYDFSCDGLLQLFYYCGELILTLACLIQVGNVYAQFREEEQAAAALQGMTGRFYAGMLSVFKFSCFQP